MSAKVIELTNGVGGGERGGHKHLFGISALLIDPIPTKFGQEHDRPSQLQKLTDSW